MISYFRNHYIRNGIFDPEVSKQIGLLQDAREDSDYNMLIRFDLESAEMHFNNAKAFLAAVKPYLTMHYGENG